MSTFDVPSSQQEPDRVGALCAVLAKERRRHILYALRDADDTAVTVEELVQLLAEQEGADDGGERIERCLYHVSLPTLADAGIIEHDRRSGCVRYRPTPLLERLLAQVTALDQRDL
ncbi:DUF7344 domain-containing protein [Haloferax prahovense]|uniref:DUF7344 domain-containing protein n=1 Tax=Haloferax prahovense TaxID=381852 RepID=UPI000A057682|nr:hypothetical protein [Haloferax prahovense]